MLLRLVNTAILLGSWILLSTVALAQHAGPPKSGVLRGIVIASDASDTPATLRARLIDRWAGGPWLSLQPPLPQILFRQLAWDSRLAL